MINHCRKYFLRLVFGALHDYENVLTTQWSMLHCIDNFPLTIRDT